MSFFFCHNLLNMNFPYLVSTKEDMKNGKNVKVASNWYLV